MWIMAASLASLLVGAILVEMAVVIGYVRRFHRWMDPSVNDSELPRVAVILSLRGMDPFLSKCLDRLTTQDYPCYEVHVVIDHRTDPARKLVETWLKSHPDRSLRISFLEERSDEAYLKSSAVRQCVAQLDSSVGAVVLADADTIVYHRWLRDMVSPMADEAVGVVTGNRWYDPTLRNWGSLVRFIHNGWSIPTMYFMGITWGGCLAFRREVFDQEFFHERMRKTVTEEQAILDAARHVGKRLEIHPHVMLINREEYTLPTCFKFMRRQMIWTRLYYADWWNMWLLILANLVAASSVATLVGCIWVGQGTAAAILGLALVFQLLTHQFIPEWLHSMFSRKAGDAQGASYPAIAWPTRLRMMAVQPLTLIFFGMTVTSAWLSRHVHWRGITYKIEPPDAIRMVEYRSYAVTAFAVGADPTVA